MKRIWIIQCITFLSAFLLFQLELIIAKKILPIYGGSYLVWGGCLVFFQATLFLGYCFPHFVIRKIGFAKYRLVHLLLFILTFVFFPGKALPNNYSVSSLPMVIDLFWQLLTVIGPAFFILSTTSIVTQTWVYESNLPQKNNPYALYATSNLGSMLALLSYPIFFEIFYDLLVQETLWRTFYLILFVLNIIAFLIVSVNNLKPVKQTKEKSVSIEDSIRWILFAAAGVMMFLSVTNLITVEIVPMPLLWVLPLSIYLLTYILSFKKNPWCPKWINSKINLAIGYSVFAYFAMQTKSVPLLFGVLLLLFLLFHICMFCQSQLYKHRPKDKNNLTYYYLMVSLGGFLGGIFVTWVVPVLSTSLIEYLISLLCVVAGMLTGRKEWKLGIYNVRLIIYMILILFICPISFPKHNVFFIIVMLVLIKLIYTEYRTNVNALAMSLVIIFISTGALELAWSRTTYIHKHRNYYGLYRIYDKENVRYLVHGTTVHGAQFKDEDKAPVPLTYFSHISPVGKLLTSDLFEFKNINIQGLGAGTLATYFNASQEVDFYELDPDNFDIADKYFSLLKNSSGNINYIFGDARMSLNSLKNKKYDLLISDAFGGDSIPIHLTTMEALHKYRQIMTEDGLILVHISSRYIDHSPALYSTASSLGAYVAQKKGKTYSDKIYSSAWIAITWNQDVAEKLIVNLDWNLIDSETAKKRRPWTDQYSNLLPYLLTENFIDDLKRFKNF